MKDIHLRHYVRFTHKSEENCNSVRIPKTQNAHREKKAQNSEKCKSPVPRPRLEPHSADLRSNLSFEINVTNLSAY